jgi:hypothetical protein
VSGYENVPEPPAGDDEALTSAQCFARARRALEESELELRDLAYTVRHNATTDEQLQIIHSLAYIGHGWAELGAALRRAER